MKSSGTVCVDASFVVPLVVAGPLGAIVSSLWQEWRRREQVIVAPGLLWFEVTNALHRYTRAGFLEPSEARQALQVVLRLPIQFEVESSLHDSALEVAARFRLPAAYDAHYLVVAERHGAELWTADARLARVVGGELPWVKLLAPGPPPASP